MDSVSFQVLTNALLPNRRHCWLWPHVPAATASSYWTSEPASSCPLQFVPFPLPPHSPFCHGSVYTTVLLQCPWSILLGSVSRPLPSSSCIFLSHMVHSCSLGARPLSYYQRHCFHLEASSVVSSCLCAFSSPKPRHHSLTLTHPWGCSWAHPTLYQPR